MWPGLMQRLLVLPAEVHSRFSLLCIWSVWCVGRIPVLLSFSDFLLDLTKMLGCCVECWQCTANTWWCITKHICASSLNESVTSRFYLLCSRLHLALLSCPSSPRVAVFISVSCCWSVSQRRKSATQNQNKPCLVAAGRCVARLKNKKSFFFFPPLPETFPSANENNAGIFHFLKYSTVFNLCPDSLSRSEYSSALPRMRVCFVTANCVFFTLVPLVSYWDVITAQCCTLVLGG